MLQTTLDTTTDPRCVTQVSVLKQALAEGEEVDVQDEAGLTALMWAARAGRLSTAKYLVSQGASLERRDETTGFSPLHFAAYYCRYFLVDRRGG